MPERYKPDEAAHSISIGKKIFIVSSFTDTQATVTAEELIIKMLKAIPHKPLKIRKKNGII